MAPLSALGLLELNGQSHRIELSGSSGELRVSGGRRGDGMGWWGVFGLCLFVGCFVFPGVFFNVLFCAFVVNLFFQGMLLVFGPLAVESWWSEL